jgi:TPR repeat protein
LAKRYLEPFDTDEQPNLNKALPLLIRSAGLGNKEALELLKYQADSGWFIKGNANAAFALGEIFLRGIGVAANSTEAIYWYNLAAKQGMMEAKKKLVEIQKLASKK